MAIKYSQEEVLFLKTYIPSHTHRETVEEHNKRYPDNPMTIRQSHSFVKNYKVKTNYNGRFVKGQTAPNKGKKWDDFMSKEAQANSRKTTFQKGNKPHNHKPVGSIRLTRDGYWEIKTAEPKTWTLMNRYVWEKHHGPVPADHAVIFLDGDTNNYDISNLALVSRQELIELTRQDMRTEYAQITESYLNVLRLMEKVNERR